MKTIATLILLLCSTTLFAESQTRVAPLKAVIESFNLEEQMITLHGQSYLFAKKIVILDKNNSHVGFSGLNSGQVIEFEARDSHGKSFREDINSKKTITRIKILSDNKSDDEVH